MRGREAARSVAPDTTRRSSPMITMLILSAALALVSVIALEVIDGRSAPGRGA